MWWILSREHLLPIILMQKVLGRQEKKSSIFKMSVEDAFQAGRRVTVLKHGRKKHIEGWSSLKQKLKVVAIKWTSQRLLWVIDNLPTTHPAVEHPQLTPSAQKA